MTEYNKLKVKYFGPTYGPRVVLNVKKLNLRENFIKYLQLSFVS